MRITEQVVKTMYTIEITWDDFKEAFAMWENSNLKELPTYRGAFNFSTDPKDEDSLISMRSFFEHLQFMAGSRQTVEFIVKEFFHFDSVENYGYYKENCNAHLCIVSNRGDDINQ